MMKSMIWGWMITPVNFPTKKPCFSYKIQEYVTHTLEFFYERFTTAINKNNFWLLLNLWFCSSVFNSTKKRHGRLCVSLFFTRKRTEKISARNHSNIEITSWNTPWMDYARRKNWNSRTIPQYLLIKEYIYERFYWFLYKLSNKKRWNISSKRRDYYRWLYRSKCRKTPSYRAYVHTKYRTITHQSLQKTWL